MDNAADKLLMRYRVAMARQALAGAATGPLAPAEASARRSALPAAVRGPPASRLNSGREQQTDAVPCDLGSSPAQLSTAEASFTRSPRQRNR